MSFFMCKKDVLFVSFWNISLMYHKALLDSSITVTVFQHTKTLKHLPLWILSFISDMNWMFSEPSNCDICFLTFPSRRLLEHHRNKHFDGEGSLTETALALHIQGLSKHGMDENLTDRLAEQVEAYREKLRSGSKTTHNGENVVSTMAQE